MQLKCDHRPLRAKFKLLLLSWDDKMKNEINYFFSTNKLIVANFKAGKLETLHAQYMG